MTRQRVAGLAQREGWEKQMVGNAALYAAEDVREYRDTRYRTELVKKAGWWSGRGLYRDADLDIACPVCEGFAVERPLTAEGEIDWICLKGHSSPPAPL